MLVTCTSPEAATVAKRRVIPSSGMPSVRRPRTTSRSASRGMSVPSPPPRGVSLTRGGGVGGRSGARCVASPSVSGLDFSYKEVATPLAEG